MREKIWIPASQAEKYTFVHRSRNPDGPIRFGVFGTVIDKTNTDLIIMWDEEKREKIPLSYEVYVEMPKEQYNKKWREPAAALAKALRNELAYYEIGYHEMNNSWIEYDLFEMAEALSKREFNVIGICTDSNCHRFSMTGELLDCGVVAEYPDGEKFWCHCILRYLKDAIEEFEEENNSL